MIRSSPMNQADSFLLFMNGMSMLWKRFPLLLSSRKTVNPIAHMMLVGCFMLSLLIPMNDAVRMLKK